MKVKSVLILIELIYFTFVYGFNKFDSPGIHGDRGMTKLRSIK